MAGEDIPFERIGGYRVVRRLATGGTSDVLLARAEGPHGFERTVVLKLLLRQFQRDAPMEKMFAREAAAYARLSHPAIVKLYDFFSAEGQLVMVLELVDGLPLNRFRAMLRQSGDALDDRASIFVASRIFAALAAAHGARDPETGEFAPMIHRDVNPSNVLIPWDGHVKLADFGIAKVAGVPTDTQSGFIKGTYGYMAPEQVRGEPVTVRTDVYAASLLLWELLARRKAIQRGALPDDEVVRAMANPSLPSLDVLRPDLPQRLREVVMRGLESQPDQRSVTAEEMLIVLRESVTSNEGRNVLVEMLSRVRPDGTDLATTQSRPPPPDLRPRVSAPPVAASASRTLPPSVAASASRTPPLPTAPPSREPPAGPASSRQPDSARPPFGRTIIGVAPSPIEAFVSPPSPRVSPSAPPAQVNVNAATPRAANVVPSVTVTSIPPPPWAAPAPPAAALPPTPMPAPVSPPPATKAPDVELPGFFAAALVGSRGPNGSPSNPPMRVPLSAPPPGNGSGSAPPSGYPTSDSFRSGTPTEPPMRVRDLHRLEEVRRVPIGAGKSATYALVAGIALLASATVVAVLLLVNRASNDPRGAHAVVGAAGATQVSSPPVRDTAATISTATSTATATPTPTASSTPTPSSTPISLPTAVASAPAPPATGAYPSPPLAVTPLPNATTGRLLTPSSGGSHRIFVDGRYAGDSPTPVTVHCGTHSVKVGSHGAERDIDVPCGGDVSLVGH